VGSFSHINAQVEAQLRKRFSDLEVEAFDVLETLRSRKPGQYFSLSVLAGIRHASRIARTRIPPKDFVSRLVPGWRAIQNLASEIGEEKPTRFTFQTQSLFDARGTNTPHFVYTDHTYRANELYAHRKQPFPVSSRWKQMEARLYQDATCTFTTSEFVNRSLAEGYKLPESRMECVFSGSNLPIPEAPADPGRNHPIVLFVGVEWERKGGPQLVEAFAGVKKDLADAELWIVGCQPNVSGPGIRIMGRVPLEEVAGYYRQARLFALPSLREPSATVLMEAAGYGLPIVATDVGGSAERVEHEKTGLLSPPGDTHSLAANILRILSSPTLADEMGRAGRSLVEAQFTWDAVGEKLQRSIDRRLDQE